MSVRLPVVAGRFYESDGDQLCKYVQSCFDEAAAQLSENDDISLVRLVFLPHAGHFFCGHVMAATLAQVQLSNNLILLGPNHTGQGKPLSVWAHGQWQSPLGNIPINTNISKKILQSDSGFESDIHAHLNEHSLEVILPFLQLKQPDMQIVPIAVGGRDFNLLKKAGYALGNIVKELEAIGEKVTIIVSSDLHHFSDHNTTMALDDMAIQAFMQLNPMKLAQVVGEHKISMCGVCPSIVALYALEKIGKVNTCHLVNHTTSYEKSNDFERVVGYAGLFVKENTCKKI